jgi:hypothetical protein
MSSCSNAAGILPCPYSFPLGFFISSTRRRQVISFAAPCNDWSPIVFGWGLSRFQILPYHVKHLSSIGAIHPDDPFQAGQVVVVDRRKIICDIRGNLDNQRRPHLGFGWYTVRGIHSAFCIIMLLSASHRQDPSLITIPPQGP